jgi:hypothetical protein
MDTFGMTEEDLAQLLESDPAALDQILQTGAVPARNKILDEQIARADAMRTAQMPGMRGGGRVVVAASPLEVLATGIDRYRGAKDVASLTAQQGGNLDALVGGRGAYLKALVDAQRRRQPVSPDEVPTQAPQMAPDGSDAEPNTDYDAAYYEQAGYDYQPDEDDKKRKRKKGR